MKRFYSLARIASLIVLGVTILGLASLGVDYVSSRLSAAAGLDPGPQAAFAAAPPDTSNPPPELEAMQAALERIYSDASPSVVTIHMTKSVAGPSMPNFPFDGRQFRQGPQSQIEQGLGSGFVWDTQGHIVTNNHVVDGAQTVDITFADGTTVKGKVIGNDPTSDLAVVQVNAPAYELHPVTFADSTQVKVGEFAIAIGNPFGEQNTMTTGIVSAIGRSLPADDGSGDQNVYTIPDVIQTDAPINPGNSGGVLLNDEGQVIGVTTAIESPVGTSAGIGFAIPSAIVQKVVPALIASGHYDHPWLGIVGTTLTPDLASAMNLRADQHGALVIEVTADSPAAQAKMQGSTRNTTILGEKVQIGGDVITAINGKPVKTFEDLVAYLVNSTGVNQTVTLTLLRGGKEQTVPVNLSARPAPAAPVALGAE